jgi:CheY-like chemotaxis protein
MASDRQKEAMVVLVVDDDLPVLRVTAELFRYLGHDVARALRPALHVIVTSGSALPRYHVQFIRNPYHIADLVAALPAERALHTPVV